jgi:hypothetical protein
MMVLLWLCDNAHQSINITFVVLVYPDPSSTLKHVVLNVIGISNLTHTCRKTMPSLKPPMIKGKYENKSLESHIL